MNDDLIAKALLSGGCSTCRYQTLDISGDSAWIDKQTEIRLAKKVRISEVNVKEFPDDEENEAIFGCTKFKFQPETRACEKWEDGRFIKSLNQKVIKHCEESILKEVRDKKLK